MDGALPTKLRTIQYVRFVNVGSLARSAAGLAVYHTDRQSTVRAVPINARWTHCTRGRLRVLKKLNYLNIYTGCKDLAKTCWLGVFELNCTSPLARLTMYCSSVPERYL